MKAGFTIDNSYYLIYEFGFFYLWNWHYDNTIFYTNFREKIESYKYDENCVGVWKLKQLNK